MNLGDQRLDLIRLKTLDVAGVAGNQPVLHVPPLLLRCCSCRRTHCASGERPRPRGRSQPGSRHDIPR